MFASLCEELSILPGGGCNKMAKAIAAKLNDDPRPIFLDEADYIVDSKVMTESLRDLHDMTHVPVILIGMEQMMKKLERREQLFNRLSQQVKFQKADIDDTRLLADRLCEIKVADDLLAQLLATPEVGGVVRRIVVALAHIEQRAKLKGLTRMDSATWGRSRTFLVEEPVGPQQ